jgi:hypothetical protein
MGMRGDVFVEILPEWDGFSGRTAGVLGMLPSEVVAVEYSRGALRIFLKETPTEIPRYLEEAFGGFEMRIVHD